MKRMLALAMALALLCAALPAVADGTVSKVSLSNVTLKQDDQEKVAIGLTAAFQAATEGERSLFSGLIKGGTLTVADFQVAVDGDQGQFSLDGLSNNYTISRSEMEREAKDQGTAVLYGSQMRALQPAAEAMVREMLDTDLNRAASTPEALESLGYTRIGEEAVTVQGEAMTLVRYEATHDPEARDQAMLKEGEYYPAAYAFAMALGAVNQSLAAASGEADEPATDDPNYYARRRDELGEDMRWHVTMWTDETGQNTRSESLETITTRPKGGGDKVMRSTATVTEVRMKDGVLTMRRVDRGETETGLRSTVTAIGTATTEPGKLRKGSFSYETLLEQPEGAKKAAYAYPARSRFAFEVDVDLDGSGTDHYEALFLNGVDSMGPAVSLDLTYEKPAANGAQAAHIALGYESTGIDDKDGKNVPSKTLIELDALIESADLSGGPLFDDGGRPSVDMMNMTDEQQRVLEQEATTKMFMAYGALMQTEGIAKLLAGSMLDMRDAVDAMLDGIDGPGTAQFSM